MSEYSSGDKLSPVGKQLKPCPFCGGVACQSFSVWAETYKYGCLTSGCMGNVHNQLTCFKTDIEAIEAWNTRTQKEG